MLRYHDEEWGVPVHDDGKLFEFLILEGVQAGLSWMTVLKKRENYRQALKGFDPAKVARFTDSDVRGLLSDPGLIRNRLKMNAAVNNARCFLQAKEEYGSFDSYIWQFTGRVVRHRFRSLSSIPAKTKQSDAMSRDLQRRGFKFVGSTICYAFMQAVGMVNDHAVNCFRYRQV